MSEVMENKEQQEKEDINKKRLEKTLWNEKVNWMKKEYITALAANLTFNPKGKWENDALDPKELNEWMKTTIDKQYDNALKKVWMNAESSQQLTAYKDALMKQVEAENDPNKKIEKFQEVMDALNARTWQEVAEDNVQGKKFTEAQKVDQEKAQKTSNEFWEHIKKLREAMSNIQKEWQKKHQKNVVEAQNKTQMESKASQESAKKSIEWFSMVA